MTALLAALTFLFAYTALAPPPEVRVESVPARSGCQWEAR
ncbi:hypothetical protein SMD44_00907 [Streptomyces alboflavus]|uniref:Uncharacterized protein n=1 Tax=Streptomyces alboflavus TaxID=67267 RepID=A0A1Z1W558_9ACTN|nr:hypothetical protein SMD44_00907 [Streptomyces alboflavus]